ncbi:prolyl 3-hydroxylase OGFOD1-like isoform X2 [Macrobrachium rosenbergii]|uniref:prolyl 3-hydroxylase OGFOD1-like isoform X2 n=1 Tax=Macrobrachium rosenbergii TaxID=79674 RepID=UPI0034D51D29
MGSLDEKKPINVEGNAGSLGKSKNKKEKNLSKQTKKNSKKPVAGGDLEQSNVGGSNKLLPESSINKPVVMGKKKRKMKEDSVEDALSKKTKIQPEGKQAVSETLPIVRKDNKVGNCKSTLTKKGKLGKRKDTQNVDENDEKAGNEPALKKLKVENEKANGDIKNKMLGTNDEQQQLSTDAATSKKKKKKKKKKQGRITEASEVKETDEKVNDEPSLKKLKVEDKNSSNEGLEVKKLEISDKQQQFNADAATGKKKKKKAKRKKHTSIIEATEVKEETKEVGSPGSSAKEPGKKNKKKKNKGKKVEMGKMNQTVTDVAKPSFGEVKSSESAVVEEKNKKVPKAEGASSGTGKSQSKKNGIHDRSSKDSSNEAVISTPVKLNEAYGDEPRKDEIVKCWSEGSPLQKDNGFKLLTEPFKCIYMPYFLQDGNFLQKVKEELSSLELHKKSNDLYKFKQTSDLKSVSSPCIESLRKFFYGDFRKWLSDVTGIELNDTVDMGSSCYEYTDVLLCHDDELKGRRVAYILYLTPPWYEKDGGTLDLFDVDNKGQPRDVVTSLLPKWNTLAFFEVSPVSFHQVREVLSRNKTRLSINGWFHGPSVKRAPKHNEPPREFLSPVHLEVLKQEKLPDVVADCMKFLKSEALFLILSQLTGLRLHRLAPPDSDPDSDEEEESKDSNPGMIIDIRQWGHGCYTLLRDCDQAERSSALDASLFVRVSNKWTLEHGGFTSYIAKDEDEELLTVVPRSNCLALVYRDTETLKFTKYINASVKDLGNKDSVFYEFSCTYRE